MEPVKVKYRVLKPMRHNGQPLNVGSIIMMTPRAAKYPILAGHLEVVDPDKPTPAASSGRKKGRED